MWGRHLIAAAFALLAMVVAAGCGGDDDSGTASAASSKAEFTKEANAICKQTVSEIQTDGSKIYNEEGGLGEEAEFGRRVVVEVLVPSFERQIREIRQLEIPPNDQAKVNAIFIAISRFLRQLEANPAAEEFYPYKKAEALADKYGLTACARPAL